MSEELKDLLTTPLIRETPARDYISHAALRAYNSCL